MNIQWTSLNEAKPDNDETVLLYNKDASEPVWPGFHDGREWRYVDSHEAHPTHWAPMPGGPA